MRWRNASNFSCNQKMPLKEKFYGMSIAINLPILFAAVLNFG